MPGLGPGTHVFNGSARRSKDVDDRDEPGQGAGLLYECDDLGRKSEAHSAKIPGAQKLVIPGAGHAANLDQPELFNRAVADFLTGLPE